MIASTVPSLLHSILAPRASLLDAHVCLLRAAAMRTTDRATKASALCIAAFCLVPGASASVFRNDTSNPRRALSQQQRDSWYSGTATWYGGPDGPGPDGMSIYTGSCKYGKNIPSHFVSAINTDGGYDYGARARASKARRRIDIVVAFVRR